MLKRVGVAAFARLLALRARCRCSRVGTSRREQSPPASERRHCSQRDCSQRPKLLFLLAGQSNMAGRGPLETSSARAPVAAAWCFSQRTHTWEPSAADPLHSDKPEKAGVGPGLSFARLIAEAVPSVAASGVGLVPCAWGSSELSRWLPEGDLHREALRRASAALHTAGAGARFAGILWHQGESDCGSEELAGAHAAGAATALQALRDGLGDPALPVVLGEVSLSPFLESRPICRICHAAAHFCHMYRTRHFWPPI